MRVTLEMRKLVTTSAASRMSLVRNQRAAIRGTSGGDAGLKDWFRCDSVQPMVPSNASEAPQAVT